MKPKEDGSVVTLCTGKARDQRKHARGTTAIILSNGVNIGKETVNLGKHHATLRTTRVLGPTMSIHFKLCLIQMPQIGVNNGITTVITEFNSPEKV